jgi:dTDP-4-dehydrorhamnose reductase
MRVVVVGAAGQVGRNLVSLASERGDWVGATYKARRPPGDHVTLEPLDKTDASACDVVLGRLKPDVVIDTGAMHNVDYCETHPDEANAVNRDGTRFLAESSRRLGARFVFISTDFVFDGSGTVPYGESSVPRPQSAYARSKLAGEEATMATNPDNLVVRPSVIYSWLDTRQRAESSSGKGLNFGTWLVEEVARGRPVRIINDQVASPTLASDLAGAILALVGKGCKGTFHTAGSTPANRHAFSVQLVARLGLDTSLVLPVATADLAQKAVRPTTSSLTSARLTTETGYRMMDLREALNCFAADFGADPGAGALRSPPPGAS